MKTKNIIIKCIVCFLILTNCAFAEISIRYRNFEALHGENGEPLLQVEVLATQDGSDIELTKQNTYIIQTDVSLIYSLTIAQPGSENYQLLSWSLAFANSHIPKFELLVNNNNELATRQLPSLSAFEGYEIICRETNNNNFINEIYFPPTTGTQQFKQFYFGVRGSYDSTAEWSKAPFLDSITFTDSNMSYIWTGILPDKGGSPPKKLLLENLYMITVLYDRPNINPDVRAWMTFHFAGNIQYKLPIYTNIYPLTNQQSLKLLSPVGNEKLAPCQQFTIEWTGQSKKHPVYIRYSTDNKETWNSIATVSGDSSQYIWDVPRNISDSCFISISQSFIMDDYTYLHNDNDSILSAVFNDEATRAILIGNNNEVIEYELYPQAQTGPNIITQLKIDELNANIVDVEYIENNKIVALDKSNNKLYFINTGSNQVQNEVKLATNLELENLYIFDTNKICIQTRRFNNLLLFFDDNGNIITKYSDSLPITAIDFCDNDTAFYIALIDNTIRKISYSNFPTLDVVENYTFAYGYNIIESIKVAIDGSIIGVSFRDHIPIGANSRNTAASNIIYDKNKNYIIRDLRYYNNQALSINFNAIGTMAILAHRQRNPQCAMIDLTNENMQRTHMDFFNAELSGLILAKTTTSLLAYSNGDTNALIMNFGIPETAIHTIPFSIKKPIININPNITISDTLIGTTAIHIFPLRLCNIGEVEATITNTYWRYNEHFALDYTNTIFPLILQPGECVDVEIVAIPKDTGNISDDVFFVTCDDRFGFNINMKSINRNLQIIDSIPINMGEVCLYEYKTSTLNLFRNNDAIPVKIDSVAFKNGKNFEIEYFPSDTIIEPNGVYTVSVTFSPKEINILYDTLMVYYADQTNVTLNVPFQGKSIGTFFDVSHRVLPFIPEIDTRSFSIKNTGDAVCYIDSIIIEPHNLYQCVTSLPIKLNPNEIVNLEFQYISDTIKPANVVIIATPCVKIDTIKFVPYSGTANLTIQNVETSSKDTNATIVIDYNQYYNYEYQGNRFFEAEFTINPRIFYPKYVHSNYGTSKIIKNEVINDKRYIKVRVDGDFNSSINFNNELIKIVGIAALCETNHSVIEFDEQSLFFGDSVLINFKNGDFLLTDICNDRYITKEKISINSISPIPTNNFVNINYDINSDINGDVTYSLIDLSGNNLFYGILEKTIGNHKKYINLNEIAQGSYKIIIYYENFIISRNINVIK